MTRISINLLPPEVLAKEQKEARFYKIQAIGIVIILIMIFLTSLTLALGILQSRNISVAQANIAGTEQKISSLKDTEASLFLLKNRLTTINEYLGVPSKQSSAYRLIDRLVPPQIAVNTISIGSTGEISLMALVPDGVSLDALMTNLTTKEQNEDKISQVSIENLSRGKDGFYRISLRIKTQL